MSVPQISWLPDRRRLHFNHGPMDLIVETFGQDEQRRLAYEAAIARFRPMLDELVSELVDLRRPVQERPRPFNGATACRMERAAARFHPDFITPMAAVAGAVADEVLTAMTAAATLDKAYVNDGGDVAFHLSGRSVMRAAIAGTGGRHRITIGAADPVRGMATSGWRGRSFSLGIADAVTVLAADGAAADAAATIIANAVDLPDHPAIIRTPACELAPDSDLGSRLVTTAVGALTPDEVERALQAGGRVARDCLDRGLIHAAALFLAGDQLVIGQLRVTLAGDATGSRATDREAFASIGGTTC